MCHVRDSGCVTLDGRYLLVLDLDVRLFSRVHLSLGVPSAVAQVPCDSTFACYIVRPFSRVHLCLAQVRELHARRPGRQAREEYEERQPPRRVRLLRLPEPRRRTRAPRRWGLQPAETQALRSTPWFHRTPTENLCFHRVIQFRVPLPSSRGRFPARMPREVNSKS